MNGQSPTQFTALAPFYDELMEVVPYDLWAEYVLLLLEVVEHKGPKLLDCACGTGNVSFELAKLGFEVTGVDIAPEMIAVAIQKAREISPAPRFFVGDLANFDLKEKFQTATCLYDSLNYILDPQKLELAFARIAAHLETGGIFVFDLNSEYALSADLFTQFNRDPHKNLHYDWHAKFDPKTRICEVEMLFKRQNADGSSSNFSERHRERAYSRTEIESILSRTGWDLLKTFDAYTLNLPFELSERWFFVARRESA